MRRTYVMPAWSVDGICISSCARRVLAAAAPPQRLTVLALSGPVQATDLQQCCVDVEQPF